MMNIETEVRELLSEKEIVSMMKLSEKSLSVFFLRTNQISIK